MQSTQGERPHLDTLGPSGGVSSPAETGLTCLELVGQFVPAWVPGRDRVVRSLTRWVDGLSGLRDAEALHAQVRRLMAERGVNFVDASLEVLSLSVQVAPDDLQRIPRTGGLIVVANHPYGGLEGLVLASMLMRVREGGVGDVKVMGNYLLGVFEGLRHQLIAVDPFSAASARSSGGLREAIRHVESGGSLVVFPAGEVSSLRLKELRVVDPPWQRGVGLLIRKTQASVLPVYIPGGNGHLFQLAGLLHPRLRTALLPRATVARRGGTMEVRVGRPLNPRKLRELAGDGGDEVLVEQLRARTYLLRHRRSDDDAAVAAGHTLHVTAGDVIIPETPADAIDREIAALPEEAVLLRGEEYEAYVARPRQIPHVLREIGRLREITFRAVGEGTGKSLDLDEFDQHYLHLFVYHRPQRQLVGAYRLGRADLILRARGKRGLYTSTLFDYPESLLSRLAGGDGSALEMGRSFVRQEYQRSHQPLMMLWRGIAVFCCRNPRYHTLFGPVSISSAYATVSRTLMVEFLSASGLRGEWANLVKPRTPFKVRRHGPGGLGRRGEWLDAAYLASLVRGIDELSEVVREVEPDAKGVPVLLGQYLKLGARVLAFNVDRDFGGCVDALVTVDLRRTDDRLLRWYMKADYPAFARRWGLGDFAPHPTAEPAGKASAVDPSPRTARATVHAARDTVQTAPSGIQTARGGVHTARGGVTGPLRRFLTPGRTRS